VGTGGFLESGNDVVIGQRPTQKRGNGTKMERAKKVKFSQVLEKMCSQKPPNILCGGWGGGFGGVEGTKNGIWKNDTDTLGRRVRFSKKTRGGNVLKRPCENKKPHYSGPVDEGRLKGRGKKGCVWGAMVPILPNGGGGKVREGRGERGGWQAGERLNGSYIDDFGSFVWVWGVLGGGGPVQGQRFGGWWA